MSKSVTTLICPICNKEFNKEIAEITRQQKKKGINVTFYCSRKCNGIANSKKLKFPTIVKICPTCGKEFLSTRKAKAATFCSRSCASKGSVNEARRNAGRNAAAMNFTHDIKQMKNALLGKEGWKYAELEKYLKDIDEPHEFEYVIGTLYENPRIYDLVLFNRKLLIEFDGPDHKYITEDDKIKEEIAKKNGFEVKRIKTMPNTIIEPNCIYKFLK